MPRTLKPEEIVAILERGAFDDLVGVIEDHQFEAKSKPYSIEKPYGKRELAKDVAAFANARGGIIIIGAKTEGPVDHLADEVKDVHLFAQDLLNRQQYYDVLRDWIYPRIEDVAISWYQSVNDPGKGVVGIMIPNQSAARRPFLIAKTLDEENSAKQVGLVFGYVERSPAGNEPTRVHDLQTWLRDGKRFDDLGQRLDSVGEELRTLRSLTARSDDRQVTEASIVTEEELHHRILTAIEAVQVPHSSAFYLAATTVPAVDVDGLFSNDSKITVALKYPPTLRQAGFDLTHEQDTRIVEGHSRRAVFQGRKLLEIFKDGSVVFVVEPHSSPCYWGSHAPKKGLVINSLALCETIYSFADFTRIVFGEAKPPPKGAVYYVGFRNVVADDEPTKLMAGPLTTWGWSIADQNPAPQPTQEFRIDWDCAEIRPGGVAYLLVREIYRWFGFNDDEIPYVSDSQFGSVIDPEEIKKPPS